MSFAHTISQNTSIFVVYNLTFCV